MIPKKIKVSEKDIIMFSNFSFYVNLDTVIPDNENKIELNQIGDKRQYKFVDYDPLQLLINKFDQIVPEEEIRYMKKYYQLVNIFFISSMI